MCDPGDEVVCPDPGFPIYESAIRWAGATPIPLPLRESNEFALDPDELASLLSSRTKLVILNSPHNPTGSVLGVDAVREIASLLLETPAWVLSDEIYSRLVYDGDFASPVSEPGLLEKTILVDGFSKTFAMTGWRCGFVAVPNELVDPLTRFFVNSTSCVAPFVQRAGAAALTGPQDDVRAMVEEFRQRRAIVVEGLNSIEGIACLEPRGAFYGFPSVRDLPIGADEFASRLLEERGVATLTGSTFGEAGSGYIRISYASSQSRLREALIRIRAFVDEL